MTTLTTDWLQRYPAPLVRALARLAQQRGVQFYITGGTVRDWLLGRMANDLDITVAVDGMGCARNLAKELGGSYVPLDADEDVARVVWQQITVDFAGFRERTFTINADLRKRDFTMNGLAIPFAADRQGLHETLEIIDPGTGIADLNAGLVRCSVPDVFESDPLRLLRAYRFMATLGFSIEVGTAAAIRTRHRLINNVSPERVSYELGQIMASERAAVTVRRLRVDGLLAVLFPELQEGEGVVQPASHHLDVLEHGLAALAWMETILATPGDFFPGQKVELLGYLAAGPRPAWLKWAALFHDLGKPAVCRIRPDKGGRITFYNHDRVGGERFARIAGRLKWSRLDTRMVVQFIVQHMWPFHLNNARLRTGLTPRAYLRLVKATGVELPGLFLLAMADSLAGQGPGKPAGMEAGLALLFGETIRVARELIEPVLAQPRLLTGHDLMAMGIPPGPLYRRILDELETAQVEGVIENRSQAVQWLAAFVEKQGFPAPAAK
ncbi:MAG: hypothetical protein A2521_16235 [Deltaproteobacteria bacterium RIFOXYD12_FULL_57_12]|nr:MAG: hypothetical protein A2521_16235 [Deltaproteobacteria bacterium RIFOXYD12_FULL_57_12]